MASPFKVFRKHQKGLIVFFGLAAMVAFVFLSGPILQNLLSTSVRNPVVVKTTKYGNLRSSELQTLLQQRAKVVRFLRQVQSAVVRAGGDGTISGTLASQLGRTDRETVVGTWLVVQHAKQLGLVVSDQAIKKFIRDVTENRVHASELKLILKKLSLRQRYFFELLRHELLALRMQKMFEYSVHGVTPAQRWDYFNRLERKATIEAAPVPVANFARDIEDPGDEVLKEFFEQYKERYAHPNFPEPGFRRPRRIAVRYFKAETEKFAASAVSEEEIRKRYEENKDLYDRMYQDVEAPPTEEKPVEEEPTQSEGEATEKGEGPSEDPSTPTDQTMTEGEEEAAAAENVEKTPAEPAEDATGEPAPEAEGDKSGETSSIKSASPFVLTSFAQEEPAETEPAEGEPAEAESESQPPAVDSGPAEDTAAEPLQEPSAPPPESPVKDQSDAAGTPAEGEPSAESDQPKDPLAGPMGKAIRNELANEKIGAIFGEIQAKLRQFNAEQALHEADPNKPAPTKLDSDALARQHGLTTDQTRLVSQLGMMDFDIGKSYVPMGYQRSVPFLSFAFEESRALHEAMESYDAEGNRYLSWSVEKVPETIPEFTDAGVRQEVLDAWRMVKARDAAEKEAQRLRDEALASGKSLKEAFAGKPDLPVTATDPFSWMTYGSVPTGVSRTPPQLSEVKGVDVPGDEFMRAVFDLDVGEIGVAMNQPKTVAYVVRMTEANPSETVLRTQFESDRWGTYLTVGREEQRQLFLAWQEELRKGAGLEWVERAADTQQAE